ncbi:MAG TPA: hypothetical protein VFQ26_07805 [Nitrospiraceae bacterium]|nr:hypothetical protein [Nitrospiraceae bacterium]
MKKRLLAVSGIILFTTGVVFAENETFGIDQQQMNQEQRIDQGVTSGRLNEREVNRLNMQQEQVNKMETRAKSDAVMTEKERARIAAAQDRAARHIAHEKHDRQGKRRR